MTGFFPWSLYNYEFVWLESGIPLSFYRQDHSKKPQT